MTQPPLVQAPRRGDSHVGKVQVSLWITPEQRLNLALEAVRRGISRGDLMREYLEAGLRHTAPTP